MKYYNLKESRLLGKNTMSNMEDAYNIIYHSQGLVDASFIHHHDFYEISFYLGKQPVNQVINGKEYEIHQGDIVLNSLFQPHIIDCKRNENHERLNIGAGPSIMLSYSTQNANLLRIFDEGRHFPILHLNAWEFQKYMDLIRSLMNLRMNHGQELGERAIIYQMLAYLYEDSYDEESIQRNNSKRVELLSILISYIESHLEEPLSLNDLADLTNYSISHIARVFKEETNDTLNHYILEKRLQKARYLLDSSIPITEIAQMTGFNSYSYFYRAFKKAYKVSPETWRKRVTDLQNK